jgi:hypothetical protein
VNEHKINNVNEIGTFELFQLQNLSVEEIKEKLPELLNEKQDDIDKDKLLSIFFRILKDTTTTANGNRYDIRSLRK